ncbi:MAG: 4-phosphoerythronate dehydrogenase [Prevotellaceae bacterium]|jgi:erythronate-4-phosphate dehydrogenase|nr:4-phosphoerythronate dehydrogenase [Prevotellaceae bacterium]
MMKIVADENIPLLQGVFEPYAEVVYAPAGAISPTLLKGADALLIRTRTRCDAKLLAHSPVRFVATATVGADHIDSDYCRQNGIAVFSAAGCNAAAVAQYVVTALLAAETLTGKKVQERTLGIIGAGNIGRLVSALAAHMGMRVLLNDPPRAAREGTAGFVELEELLQRADSVTLHVPLSGCTRNLAGDAFFERLQCGAVFINTSRGEVTDEAALLRHRKKLGAVILDVWQNEPHIHPATLAAADIATPHIAGYSIQGKSNATTMVVRALATFFDIGALKNFTATFATGKTHIDIPCGENRLRTLLTAAYPILEDDKLLRAQPQNFEQLRNKYPLRNTPEWEELGIKN